MFKIGKGYNSIVTKKYGKTIHFENADEIIDALIKKSKDFPDKKLESMTFKEFCAMVYDSNVANFLENMYPYYSEIVLVNAKLAIQVFKKDLGHNKTYYVLGGGLSQITDNLTREFKSMGGEAVEMIPNEYYASSIHPNGDEIERLRYLPSTTNRVAILNSVMCEYRLD